MERILRALEPITIRLNLPPEAGEAFIQLYGGSF